MTDYIYKSFDSSQFLFENLWKEFPNLVTTTAQQSSNQEVKIINRLIHSSLEFCQLKEAKYFNIRTFSEGAFGMVGLIRVGTKEVKAAVFSFDPSGNKNNLFYCGIIIKTGIRQVPIKIYKVNRNHISVTDPLSDMIFGSVLGHLYDIGVNPFVCKYFGTYYCSVKKETSMLIESSTYELRAKLRRTDRARVTPAELKNILVQLVYNFFILKVYYGAVHFDSHLRNIMLTDLESTDYMYHGKKFSDLKYIAFTTAENQRVIIRKGKYLCKLIDYGCMMLHLNRSKMPRFKRDLIIETSIEDIFSIGASQSLTLAVKDERYANTTDLLFSLINVYEFLSKDLENLDTLAVNRKPIPENSDHLEVINEVSYAIFGITMTEFLHNNPELNVAVTPRGHFNWFMNNHTVGFNQEKYRNPRFLLDGLVKLCTKSSRNNEFLFFEPEINPEEISDENTLTLTSDASSYIRAFNRFEKIISYTEECKADSTSISCDIVKLYKHQLSYDTFTDKTVIDNNNIQILLKNSYFGVTPTYKNYNSWLNGIRIPKDRAEKPIEDVKVYMISLKKFSDIKIRTNDFLTKSSGFTVPLGVAALFNGKAKPLGFFANRNPEEVYPTGQRYFPPDYHPYLGVITYDGKNLQLEKYCDFLKRHKTFPGKIPINDPNVYEQSDIIATPLMNVNYQWAVTVGPILVWNGQIVFDENTLKQQSKQKIFGNSSRYLFVGNNPGYFGMTDSAEIQPQLIFVQRKNKSGFLFVEGGGYLTQGLDRTTTALLCRNLDVQKAVCVSAGFSSNVIIRENDKQVYLSKSPIRNVHGAVMDVIWSA